MPLKTLPQWVCCISMMLSTDELEKKCPCHRKVWYNSRKPENTSFSQITFNVMMLPYTCAPLFLVKSILKIWPVLCLLSQSVQFHALVKEQMLNGCDEWKSRRFDGGGVFLEQGDGMWHCQTPPCASSDRAVCKRWWRRWRRVALEMRLGPVCSARRRAMPREAEENWLGCGRTGGWPASPASALQNHGGPDGWSACEQCGPSSPVSWGDPRTALGTHMTLIWHLMKYPFFTGKISGLCMLPWGHQQSYSSPDDDRCPVLGWIYVRELRRGHAKNLTIISTDNQTTAISK